MTFSDSLTLSSATASQLTSETATATGAVATLTFLSSHADDSMSVTASLVSAPAGNTALPYLLLSETTSAEAKQGTTVLTSTATSGVQAGVAVLVAPKSATFPVNATAKFKVYMDAPTKVGTYVVKLTPAVVTGGGTLAGSAQTLTITVTQNAATDTVVASADSIINAGETSSATADVTVTGSKTTSTTAAATIKVTLKNANGNTVSAESYTATIAGPGILGSGDGAGPVVNAPAPTGRALTVKAGDVVQVFPDGSSGVATITIGSAAGVILATEKITFFGDAAKIVTTVKKAVIKGGSTVATDALSIVVTDAAGTTVSNLTTVNIVSSDVTKIAGAYTSAAATFSTTTGAYLVPLTGVAAGTANITVTTKASAAATTGVDAEAVSVRVGSSTPASVSVTADKSSYAPGEKATLTVKLLDKDGLEVAGGDTYTAIFATGGIVSSYTLGSGSADITGTGTVSYADGGKTYAVYLPVTEGDVKFSWTTGTGLATANQGVDGSLTVNVSSAATSAAIDAANEASQAASDATDAALAAADAADEATTKAQEAVDAVATLSAEVTKMINALKAQIKTLSNLVTKIAKKVKA
jgi:hypothetical protein